jgi:integrase
MLAENGTGTIPAIPLRDAFKEAVDYSGGGEAHKRNQRNYAGQLVDYWAAREVRTLDQPRNLHVRGYVQHRIELGHSPCTIRQATNPVLLLNNWAVDCINPDFRRLERSRYLKDLAPRRAPTHHYLSAEQVVQCLQAAATYDKGAAMVGFALGSLCGLRIWEICRLTLSDLTGDVLSTGQKNDSSRRLIPICGVAQRVLLEHFELYGGGGRWGGSGSMYTYKTLWSHMRFVLHRVGETTGSNRVFDCDPHEAARKTFENIAEQFNTTGDVLNAYTGRAAQTVRRRHYASAVARPDTNSEILSEKLDRLRREVVQPLEALLQKLE